MSEHVGRFNFLRAHGYWADRISRELDFTAALVDVHKNLPIEAFEQASSLVRKAYAEDGCITKSVVLQAEQLLSPYGEVAKTFTVHCIGHAHIDMNWMWGMHETVSIVLDTFRTMLKLMDEYPEFTFAQSQAATYRIVELYEPEMLKEIGKRIKEGRWEVTATAWTEFDKNLTSGESHYHQYRDARAYMKTLFDLDDEQLTVGFEPDTFGHHLRLSDILSQFGIRYYYHCRGEVDHTLYRWRGPDGGEVLVYREPTWYLGPAVSPLHDPSRGTMKALEMDMASEVIDMFATYGIAETLQVYGVGDHGGGPTRMDVEGLQDMATWPVYPSIQFSSYRKFFASVEAYRAELPVVTGEINRIFTGCYTSQSAIKHANQESEVLLYEAELFSSLAAFTSVPMKLHDSKLLKNSWEHVLFNQFHDILPGSCTSDSKNYSLGLYQSVRSGGTTVLSHALQNLANSIDTSAIDSGDRVGMRALGAGFGYHANRLGSSPHGSAEGPVRIVTLFNSTMSRRSEIVQILLWDWEDSHHHIACHDAEGNGIPVEVDPQTEIYWQHSATKILVPVSIPAYGYTTLVFESDESIPIRIPGEIVNNPRYEGDREFVLDNGLVKAVFTSGRLDLISLRNLKTGEEIVGGPSGFIYMEEDTAQGMTSWIVGREALTTDVSVRIHDAKIQRNNLRQVLSYHIDLNRSKLAVQITLDRDSRQLSIKTKVLWHELGTDLATPQLSFALRLKDSDEPYIHGVPYGTIVRAPSDQHVPTLGWTARTCGESTVQISTRGIYGFCTDRDQVRIILLRSSSDPDPIPEIGEHQKEFTITIHDGSEVTKRTLFDEYMRTCTEVQQVIHGQHGGSLPLKGNLLNIEGPFLVTAIEPSLEQDTIEIRGHETEGLGGMVSFTVPKGFVITKHGPSGETASGVGSKMKQDALETLDFEIGAHAIYSIILGKASKD